MRASLFRRSALATVSAVALVSALAACSSGDSEPTQSEAETNVCDQVAAVRSAVDEVQALSVDSTVEEAQTARDDLSTAVDDLTTSAEDLAAADAQALTDGVDAIKTAIQDVAGADTIVGALTDIQTSADGLKSAIQEIGDGYECS